MTKYVLCCINGAGGYTNISKPDVT